MGWRPFSFQIQSQKYAQYGKSMQNTAKVCTIWQNYATEQLAYPDDLLCSSPDDVPQGCDFSGNEVQVASADDPPPLSVSGHETRVLGNRSCRFGRRGALNGVSSEIMQMYTHHLTGNSRSVPSRTWVSPQWTCCRRQQSGEGLDTHIIVLWQCTECKGLAIGDTSSPTQRQPRARPF